MTDPRDVEIGRQERAWGEVIRSKSGEGCSSGESLLGFVEGRLDANSRTKVLQHIGHCAGCRDTVFQLRAAERASRPKVLSWTRFLVAKRFALAGTAMCVIAGAAVWTSMSHRISGSRKAAVANISHLPNRSGTVTHPNHIPTRVAVKDPVKPTEEPVGSQIGMPTKPTNPVPPKSLFGGDQPQTRVAMGGGGTSDVGSRALKMVLLLGPNHVYKLDAKDSHQAERKKIEQDYADNVAIHHDECKAAIDNGADSAEENNKLQASLDDLSANRDSELAALYPIVDEERESHPELKVEGDAPYQVVEVNYHHQADQAEVIEDIVVVAPWPGYVAPDRPYGWTYGHHYQPSEFRNSYVSWHDSHIGTGMPVFYGLRGRSGPVAVPAITRTATRGYAFRSKTASRYSSSAYSRVKPGGTYPNSRLSTGPSRYGQSSFSPSNPPNRITTGPAEPGLSRYRRPNAGSETRSGQPSRYSHSINPKTNIPPSSYGSSFGRSRYSRPAPGSQPWSGTGAAPSNRPMYPGRYSPPIAQRNSPYSHSFSPSPARAPGYGAPLGSTMRQPSAPRYNPGNSRTEARPPTRPPSNSNGQHRGGRR